MRNAKLDRKPVIALITAAALLIAISANTDAATGTSVTTSIDSNVEQNTGEQNSKAFLPPVTS